MQISTFTYKGQDIEVTLMNGFLAYSFNYEGKDYGAKLKLPSKKTKDVVDHSFGLLLNAIETYEQLNKNKRV